MLTPPCNLPRLSAFSESIKGTERGDPGTGLCWTGEGRSTSSNFPFFSDARRAGDRKMVFMFEPFLLSMLYNDAALYLPRRLGKLPSRWSTCTPTIYLSSTLRRRSIGGGQGEMG
mmetsp:Transcript_8880/g.24099  ORF Transcript_8880/g.24099 Transcript_8880/m.24099 type:complete len:115 (+) Transcript_8880:2200-2544(+)